jgi:acyl-CoA synthetase (AMP-forming)/AMP-acid ligase II
VLAELGEGAPPATITFITAVPVAPGGKPDKAALRARVPGGGDAEPPAPAGEPERA